MLWFVRLPDMRQPDKMKYTLKAAPAASAIELKNEKPAKAKRILVAADVHLRVPILGACLRVRSGRGG